MHVTLSTNRQICILCQFKESGLQYLDFLHQKGDNDVRVEDSRLIVVLEVMHLLTNYT